MCLIQRSTRFYYRGYQYDWETELYYLQSRYYVPQWGRFLNADIFIDTGMGVFGTNMYAYCNNDPVNLIDPDGLWGRADHENWTNSFLSGIVHNDYRTDIGNYNQKTDLNFPAWVLPYQHIHFDRSGSLNAEDTRGIYATSKLDVAISKWKESYTSNAIPKNIGYALHAMQDVQAHGNIGLYDRIADHAIRPDLTTDPNKKTWGNADNPLYRWVSGTSTPMYKLEEDPGVTASNFKTKGRRYAYTNIITIFTLAYFEEGIANHQPRRFFIY